MKKFVLLFLVLSTTNASLFSQLYVNEYSCSNFNTVTDSYGEYEDWVELYNGGATAVNLAGFWLSDKSTNIQKWQIPSGSVPAGGYNVIHFSGRGTVAGSEIHPKLSLTQTTNEWIILSNPTGTVIDSLKIRFFTKTDHAMGRQTNGSATWKLFLTPTPGAANSGSVNYYTTTPTISVQGGFYAGSQSVTLACPDAGSTIRYTLDGSSPTATSTLYAGAISIATTKVLRARAFSANEQSMIATNTYFINVDHSMPVVSIAGSNVASLLGGNQGAAGPGSFELYEEDNSFIDEGIGEFNEHGNDSWAYDQRGFDFIMRDGFGYNNDINHDIFPESNRGKFQRLILKPGANDNYPFESDGAYIRDAYVHTLSEKADLKLDVRRWRPCALYLNGQYWGLYEIREKADDTDFTDHYFQQDKYHVEYLKTWGGTWEDYGAPNALPNWNAFRAFVNSNNLGVPANFTYVDTNYNWKSLVDYFVINSVTVCTDWLNWNTSWWRGTDVSGDAKRWRYSLWDLDATFGHYINYTGVPSTTPDADPCNVENLPDPGGQGHTEILSKLLAENAEVAQYYQARYIDLLNTHLSCARMNSVLDSMLLEITPEMAGQVARWGGTMTTWQANVQQLKDFIDARCIALNQGLIDCYTLDGPYNVVVAVQPVGVGAGTVKVNSIWAPTYPWNASYFGGMDNLLVAKANPGYIFDHWHVNTSTLTQPIISDTNAFQLVANDSIIAVFRIDAVNPPVDPPVIVPEVPVDFVGVLIPTGISPNADGSNDFLTIKVGNTVSSFTLKVFDRWGKVMFQTSDAANPWNGTYENKNVNSGVYAYQLEIKYLDATREMRSGNITVVR